MKSYKIIFLVTLCCAHIFSKAQDNYKPYTFKNSIVIDVETEKPDSLKFEFYEAGGFGEDTFRTISGIVNKNSIRYSIQTNHPIFLRISGLYQYSWIAEPGDFVKIKSQNGQLLFSGIGYEKYKLKFELNSRLLSLTKPKNIKDWKTESVSDYLEWYNYFNDQLELVSKTMDTYKDKVSDYVFNMLKANYIDQNIDDRGDKLRGLYELAQTSRDLTRDDLCAIYDSTYYPIAEKWFPYTSRYVYPNMGPIRWKIYRMHLFDWSKEPLNSEEKFKLLFFEMGKKVLQGEIREKFMLRGFLDFFQELGINPTIEKLLSEYYSESSYPEYKARLREEERLKRSRNRGRAPDFIFTDLNGWIYRKGDIAGKVAVLNFWTTGSENSLKTAAILRTLEDKLRNDTNVVFLHISTDSNEVQWRKSVLEKKYTTGSGINLHAGDQKKRDEIIWKYAITDYPATFMIVNDIKLKTFTEPWEDDGKSLTQLVLKHLALRKDGPYVLGGKNNSTAYYFDNAVMSKKQVSKIKSQSLSVQTDLNEPFPVYLKKSYVTEASIYSKPNKLFILSDIEGNFDAFRKLLQTNKIIDKNYNWIFGNGHLVFAGDMFDRGLQVTECLWLIYSLEEKAKAAGGYVHFVLGNHEIMNLSGNTRYVQQKYLDNAKLLNIPYKDLYNTQTELGKWLRTKNVVEKIGDLLFAHGGISAQVNALPLSLEKINSIARAYYDRSDTARKSADPILSTLYHSYFSPFWYRHYYEADHYSGTLKQTIHHASVGQIDSTLQKFSVSRIITGHTIVADTISVHYGGKVINTDTKHAEGKSEALLIEGDKYYRVNQEGKRVLLFIDKKRKVQ